MQAIQPHADRGATSLAERARDVLDGNSTGAFTLPAAGLYPHQWSWDAAFIAIGLAHVDPLQAAAELRHLFRGQWRNGMVPHIVFNDQPGDYFPGPEAWKTSRSPVAPRRVATTGIVQPPIHATATLRVADALSEAGVAFLEETYPRLACWHDYLLHERVRHDVLLAEVWHPWETGMDNSPMWDGPLGNVDVSGLGEYHRRDTAHGHREERPTDWFYDRAITLLTDLRAAGYGGGRIQFAVQDVLFNSLLARAEHDLAEIADRVGGDGYRHIVRARRIAKMIDRELYDPRTAWYTDRDALTGMRLPLAAAAQLAPLFARVPDTSRAARIVDEWRTRTTLPGSPTNGLMASADPDHAEFSPTNYWRGPVWINIQWIIHEGLRAYGYHEDAARIRRSILTMVDREGFWEHYNLLDGSGHGAADFSWTAALTLDLLAVEARPPADRSRH
jgi:hypothetical protein